jgi:hypothetical protein
MDRIRPSILRRSNCNSITSHNLVTVWTTTANDAHKENYNELSAPPSFDYSNYEAVLPQDKPTTTTHRNPLTQVTEHNGQNDNQDGLVKLFSSLLSVAATTMEPPETSEALLPEQHTVTPANLCPPSVLHGVPTCLMRDIRIAAISAHALGSHVLLISTNALLFSYGSNPIRTTWVGHTRTIRRHTHLGHGRSGGRRQNIALRGGGRLQFDCRQDESTTRFEGH